MEKRTISMSVGKGSINHNTRAFHADNTDPQRTIFNRCYVHTPIKTAYHTLFEEALRRYNEKQTRQDRCIADYYEKIRGSKQEKPFHELIVQIGNLHDCGATTNEGNQAATLLDQYMQEFQERNPNLHVFSAHLHMDEATPHLHIDFIPYTTGSKRGLDTRVSLKQALFAQGFKGGTRGDTEWNQWVQSEKQQLASIMERQGIKWEQKGTHNEHLSVMDFKKQERRLELATLSAQVDREQQTLKTIQSQKVKIGKIGAMEAKPALLDKSKVVVDKADFKALQTMAQKHVVTRKKETKLQAENNALKAEVQTLRKENASLRSVREQLQFGQLKKEYENLKAMLEKVFRFIDRLGLRTQWEQTMQVERGKKQPKKAENIAQKGS